MLVVNRKVALFPTNPTQRKASLHPFLRSGRFSLDVERPLIKEDDLLRNAVECYLDQRALKQPVAQWRPIFLFGGKGSSFNSTNQKRMSFFSP